MRDQLPPGLPPDPFAGDPADPASALDALHPAEPLEVEDRLAVEEDLADLVEFESLLAPRGVRGLVVGCDECLAEHYQDWDMARANLLQLLCDGTVRRHEPAVDPTTEVYVSWDYCRGFADAADSRSGAVTPSTDRSGTPAPSHRDVPDHPWSG